MSVRPRIVIVDGVPMSAMVAEVSEPRAVIVAIHGGGTTAIYFDCPGHPSLSLLRTGAAAGFTVVALDRPGYGYSDSLDGPELGPLGQSFWLEDVLEGLKITGAVVVAHSIGSAIAVHLAARRPDLARRLLLLSPCCSPIYDKPMLDLRIATAPIVGTFISRHVLSRCAALLARKGLTASAFPNEVPTELAALAPERFEVRLA